MMRRTPGRIILMVANAIVGLGVLPARANDADDARSALEREPKGWIDPLPQAGPDLRGWTRGPIPPGGTLKNPSQWSFDPATGVLLCRGDGGHEWLRWDHELGDFIYHVEWRFTPVPGKKGYNSGIYTRNSADAKIWHQAQTGDGSGGFLFGDTLVNGALKRISLRDRARDSRVKPAGEWNTFEITCQGPRMSLWVNGATTCVFDACAVPRGYVGLEAEGWRIEFRNIRIKILDRETTPRTDPNGTNGGSVSRQ